MAEILIRPYSSRDAVETMQLFYDTVHTVNSRDYSEEQLGVWAPAHRTHESWKRSFNGHDAFVAVGENGLILGFADLANRNYFDRLYVHHAYQGIGIATLLAERIEATAKGYGEAIISTDASITAKPFFQKRGYQIVLKQQVARSGIFLTNYQMVKALSQSTKNEVGVNGV